MGAGSISVADQTALFRVLWLESDPGVQPEIWAAEHVRSPEMAALVMGLLLKESPTTRVMIQMQFPGEDWQITAEIVR